MMETAAAEPLYPAAAYEFGAISARRENSRLFLQGVFLSDSGELLMAHVSQQVCLRILNHYIRRALC